MEKVNDSAKKLLRVIVTGPESSGKSVLAEQLSRHYNVPLVTEYARIFLAKSKGKYSSEDLLKIAKGQFEMQKKAEKGYSGIIISDTGMLVMKIWSIVKYNTIDPWIEKALKGFADLYVLCYPDLEWEEDPLRENPLDRKVLFDRYKNELDAMGATYTVVHGNHRDEQSIDFIDSFH